MPKTNSVSLGLMMTRTDNEENQPQRIGDDFFKRARHRIVDCGDIVEHERNDIARPVAVVIGYRQHEGVAVQVVAHVARDEIVKIAGDKTL